MVGSQDRTIANLSQEERLRAQHYRLIGRLLASPPDQAGLASLAELGSDDSDLGQGLGALARAALESSTEAADDEFHLLFIGVGRGELMPFGSYYIAGFLNEKPLARLRQDMARLGIARADGISESEDHIAAECEMMAGLILGEFGAGPADLGAQSLFFHAHVAPWADRFFEDLEAAKNAVLYRPVGTIGRVFMGIERTAFQMAA